LLGEVLVVKKPVVVETDPKGEEKTIIGDDHRPLIASH
jgi:hypothetical protein